MDQKIIVSLLKNFKKGLFDESEITLNELLETAIQDKNTEDEAIISSLFGMMYRLKKEPKKSLKFYEKAEKLLPSDVSLKVISAQILIEEFNQNESALKKLKKALEQNPSPDFLHKIYSLMGLAELKSGKKQKALDYLYQSQLKNFDGIQTTANINFFLVENLLKKKCGFAECYTFLKKALEFSKLKRERHHTALIQKLISLFPSSHA